MADEHYEISFELSEAQVSRAAWAFWWQRYGLPAFIVSLVSLAGGTFFLFVRPSPYALVAVFFTVAGYHTVQSFRGYRHMRYWIDAVRRKREDQTSRMTFSSAGVSHSNELMSASYRWRLFGGVTVQKDMVLLLVAGSYLPIPKAAISPELMDYIRACLKASRGRPRCAKCGYDLRGQTVARCPECGAAFDVEKLKIQA